MSACPPFNPYPEFTKSISVRDGQSREIARAIVRFHAIDGDERFGRIPKHFAVRCARVTVDGAGEYLFRRGSDRTGLIEIDLKLAHHS